MKAALFILAAIAILSQIHAYMNADKIRSLLTALSTARAQRDAALASLAAATAAAAELNDPALLDEVNTALAQS